MVFSEDYQYVKEGSLTKCSINQVDKITIHLGPEKVNVNREKVSFFELAKNQESSQRQSQE
jgi:hypothetical protein